MLFRGGFVSLTSKTARLEGDDGCTWKTAIHSKYGMDSKMSMADVDVTLGDSPTSSAVAWITTSRPTTPRARIPVAPVPPTVKAM